MKKYYIRIQSLVPRCRAISHLDKSLETRVKEQEGEEFFFALLVGLSKQHFGRDKPCLAPSPETHL